MQDTYQKRLDALRQKMAQSDTDLVVLGPSSHMNWISGVNPHGDERPVMLLISSDYAGFLMPSLNADSVRQHTDLPFHIWHDADGPTEALRDLLAASGTPKGASRIVLDETMRTDFTFLIKDALPEAQLRFTADTVGVLRKSKDATEYDALKASNIINDLALTAAFDGLKEGMSERDVAAIIEAVYISYGAQVEFIAVAFGANGAFAHHHTGDTLLTQDTAVQIDTGCRYQGYPSDNTRCGWFGTPTAEYKQVFDIVERAVQAGLAAAHVGAIAGEVDKAARQVIEDAGYGPHFLSRTGHGLGLDLHEPPYITSNSDVVLEMGNVFSIEPGIYLADRFGIRLEEIVFLRAEGCEILSDMPREMLVR